MSDIENFCRAIVDACLDCNAGLAFVELDPGITVVQVLHDDTCPALAAIERGRA